MMMKLRSNLETALGCLESVAESVLDDFDDMDGDQCTLNMDHLEKQFLYLGSNSHARLDILDE